MNEPSELKTRIPLWLYPSTLEAANANIARDNCKSRSEFIEKAIRFYTGYVSGKEATAYLPPALVAALQSTVQSAENHISRLLFKQAVELDMMMNVLAAGIEVREDDLRSLRGRCVDEVKKTSGSVTFADAVAGQKNR